MRSDGNEQLIAVFDGLLPVVSHCFHVLFCVVISCFTFSDVLFLIQYTAVLVDLFGLFFRNMRVTLNRI